MKASPRYAAPRSSRRAPSPAAVVFAAVGLAVALAPHSAWAAGTGVWRLPSTRLQCFGYGYGPGYHAPMVRSPGYRPPEVRRLEFVPAACGPYRPTDHTLPNTGGCVAPQCSHCQVWRSEGPPVPTASEPGLAAPVVMPTPAAPTAVQGTPYEPTVDRPSVSSGEPLFAPPAPAEPAKPAAPPALPEVELNVAPGDDANGSEPDPASFDGARAGSAGNAASVPTVAIPTRAR